MSSPSTSTSRCTQNPCRPGPGDRGHHPPQSVPGAQAAYLVQVQDADGGAADVLPAEPVVVADHPAAHQGDVLVSYQRPQAVQVGQRCGAAPCGQGQV